jgi:hypothetical protein
MSAPIAHMLIAKRVRERLKATQEMAAFASNVLDAHSKYMSLGSLGPDLPYFGWKSLVDPNLPIGVDEWSYQLHSKTPNDFPLHLIEVAGRTSDPTKEDWEAADDCKFSFLCGYLTHMAADQTIHPLVNAIAGSYYQDKSARREHKTCEMHQDLYVLAQEHEGQLCRQQFDSYRFDQWPDIRRDAWKTQLHKGIGLSIWDIPWHLRQVVFPPPCPIEFVHYLQRAFVEAHAITPSEFRVELWIRILWFILRRLNGRGGWYSAAYKNLFDKHGAIKKEGLQYKRYICLEGVPFKRLQSYDAYLEEAVTLATIYVRAAHRMYVVNRISDPLRHTFKSVVVNADLGAPLEQDSLEIAETHLAQWNATYQRYAMALVDGGLKNDKAFV